MVVVRVVGYIWGLRYEYTASEDQMPCALIYWTGTLRLNAKEAPLLLKVWNPKYLAHGGKSFG